MLLNNERKTGSGFWNTYFILLLLLATMLGGCNNLPELTGFDRQAWRQDSRSCRNIRPKLLPQLEAVQNELLGLGHQQIIKLLGTPEGTSMEKSGQRKFYYYIEPGPQCQDKNQFSQANKLIVRFDILDRVTLVTYER